MSIDHKDGRGEDGARLEAHRRYIDIQYTIDGDELIGWMPLARCHAPDGVFDECKDVGFFADRPSTWVSVPAGQFQHFLSARRARAPGRTRPAEESDRQDRRGAIGRALLTPPHSDRRRVYLFVLVTTVPLALFAAVLVGASWRQQEVMVDRQNMEVARAISVSIDLEIERTIGALTVLSRFLPDEGGDYRAFYDVGKRLTPEQAWESIRLVAPSGAVTLATNVPFGQPVTLTDESWVREVVKTRQPVVSSVRKALDLRSWIVSIGVPVMRGGVVTSVLGARIRAREFGAILRRQSVPAGGVVTLADRGLTIVTRTLNEETLVGQPSTPEFAARSRTGPEGTWRPTTREGVPWYSAWSRSPLTGWTVSLAMPAATIAGPIRRSLYALTAAGIAITAMGLFGAVMLRRRLVAAQLAVAATARTLARGEPISAPESSIAELQDLSAALREAAAILRMRQYQREQAQRTADPSEPDVLEPSAR